MHTAGHDPHGTPMGHPRSPVIIRERDYDRWLNPDISERAQLEDLLQPLPAELMVGWPVGTRVNNPKLDDASLTARVHEDD
jgi:putative SOS response-associated peptidase YedK